MGQAFDRDGNVLGEAYGATKREVFDKLNEQFKQAHEIRVETIEAQNSAVRALFIRLREMPRYKCHKEVHALKIERVQLDSDDARVEGRETDGSARLFVEAPYSPLRVDRDYVRKHNPQAGGYYVVYEDGYASFSPAAAFENGYTRL